MGLKNGQIRMLTRSCAAVFLVAAGSLFTPRLRAVEGPEKTSLAYDIEAVLEGRTLVANARIQVPEPLIADGRLRLALPPSLTPGERSPMEILAIKPLEGFFLFTVKGPPLALSTAADGRMVLAELGSRRSGGPLAIEVSYRFRLNDKNRAEMGYDQHTGEPGDLWFPDIVGRGALRERFRDFRVALSAPPRTAVLTSGLRVSPPETRDGLVRSIFEAQHVEGFALNLGDGFETYEIPGEGFRIIAFYPPELREAFRTAATLAADAARWYRKAYGFFPLRQLGIAPGATGYTGGFPASNLFYIHRNNLKPDFLAMIVAHEMGHYYWGRWVQSSAEEQLDWLMLGNGIWADQLYLAQRSGKPLAQHWRTADWFRRFVLAEVLGRDMRLGVPREIEQAVGFDYNTDVRHAKGAVGVWVQAQRLGTERFLALQRELLAEFHDRLLTPAVFAQRLEKAGADGAVRFFEAFAGGGTAFDYQVAGISGRTVRVARRGQAGYPIVVEARSASGKADRKTINGWSSEESIPFELDEPITEVCLDPDGILPMASGGHPEIRHLYLKAREHARECVFTR